MIEFRNKSNNSWDISKYTEIVVKLSMTGKKKMVDLENGKKLQY